MYYYLIDPQHYDGKNFEFFQTRLLSLIGEYQITGETVRVTKLRRVKDLVTTALSRGVTTLVVAGGDPTFTEVITLCHGKEITIGYIPLSSQSEIGKILGVGNTLEEVMATIAKRRVERMDLAKINGTYFISNVYFEGVGEVEAVIDSSYKVKDKFIGGVIINTIYSPEEKKIKKFLGSPHDGRLDVVLASRLSWFRSWKYRKLIAAKRFEALPSTTIIHARSVEITNPPELPVFLSGKEVAQTPTKIEMTDEKLRVVVGRHRKF